MQVSIIFVEPQVLTWQFCSIGPFSDSFIHSFNFLFEFCVPETIIGARVDTAEKKTLKIFSLHGIHSSVWADDSQ